MPVYAYQCSSCAARFEALQRMTDPPQAACPECGAPGRRLFLPVGVVFRGPGFYATDSRRHSERRREASGLGR
jgi:putative FmdB family regulatory protein